MFGASRGRAAPSPDEEIAALRAEVARQCGLAAQTTLGSEAVLALLQRDFVFAQHL